MNETNVLDNLDTMKLYGTAKEVYELFQKEFSKEKLNEYLKLDDETFLRKIFPDSDMKKNNKNQNQDNMCFALEQTELWIKKLLGDKKFIEINSKWYGGGIKRQRKAIESFYIVKECENDKWSYHKDSNFTQEQIADEGRIIVENLVKMCTQAENNGNIDGIIKNFPESELYNHVFVHKFLHMNYPERFFNWHSIVMLKKFAKANNVDVSGLYKISRKLCALNIKKDGKLNLDDEIKKSIAFEDIVKKKSIKNIILYGPPGTGKTYNIKNLIIEIMDEDYSENSMQEVLEKEKDNVVFTTFHQSYSYEDFIIGIRPIVKDDKIAYEVKDGIFKKFCDNARNDLDNPHIFIVDEINRGNISKIFGELITIIEESKRGQSVILPYEKNGEQVEFSVPKNVYIIGTMNTADRSISMLDTALRRRFTFIEMMPNPDILDNIEAEKEIELSKLLKDMNDRIEFLYDREHTIGHAYFMNEENKTIKDLDELRFVFRYKIIPLLQEYFFDDYEKIKLVLNDDKDDDKKGFIKKIDCPESLDGNEYPSRYKISDEDWKIEDFQRIYK